MLLGCTVNVTFHNLLGLYCTVSVAFHIFLERIGSHKENKIAVIYRVLQQFHQMMSPEVVQDFLFNQFLTLLNLCDQQY